MYRAMDSVFKLNQNAKREEETKSFANCSARPGGSQIIYIPGSRKHTEVDVHIDTNVSVPGSKDAKFFSCCSVLICILSTLILILAVRYQNSELCMMEQNIVVLKQQVELLTMTSDNLHENVVILQNRVNSLMHKLHNMVGDVSENYQDIDHSHAVENNLKDTAKLGYVMDMKNRSLYSDVVEHSDSLPTSVVSLPNNISVDIFGSMFADDIETSGTVQKSKLKNISDISIPRVMDISLSVDDFSSPEDDTTDEDVRLDRTKRSNRRGNQKSSGGHRGHLNNKRKNRGTMNLLEFQDA